MKHLYSQNKNVLEEMPDEMTEGEKNEVPEAEAESEESFIDSLKGAASDVGLDVDAALNPESESKPEPEPTKTGDKTNKAGPKTEARTEGTGNSAINVCATLTAFLIALLLRFV